MIMLSVLAVLAWPSRPPPVDPASAWSQRAASVVDALATDLASAGGPPALSPGITGRLQRDVRRAERAGLPPDAGRAGVWRAVLAQVQTGLSEARSQPAAAHAALEAAALELPLMSASAQMPAQPPAPAQSTGVAAPKGPTAA